MMAEAEVPVVPGASVVVSVLGPVEARLGPTPAELRPREQALLAALVLGAPRRLPADTLIDLLWSGGRPATARKALQNHVARLRACLGAEAVVTTSSGYGLARSVATDVGAFSADLRQVTTAHSSTTTMTTTAAAALAAAGRVDTARRALARWRGTPFAELPDVAEVTAARRALGEQRLQVEEHLATDLLELGRTGEAVSLLSGLVEAEPFREQRWQDLLVATYRSGGRRDALQVVTRARAVLAEVGLDPGPGLGDLERLVLLDDPSLLGTGRPVRHPEPAEHDTAILVGRDGELEELRSRLAFGPTPGVRPVVVCGEAGIGKTSLVARLAADCEGDGVVVITVFGERHPPVPLAAWNSVVDQLRRRCPDLVTDGDVTDGDVTDGDVTDDDVTDDAAAGLSGPTRRAAGAGPLRGGRRGPAPVTEGAQERMFEAVTDLLARAAQAHAVLVIFDDLQLVPPTTLRLARLVAASGLRLGFVATARETDPEAARALLGPVERVDVIHLGGLDVDAISAYLDRTGRLAPVPDPSVTAAWLAGQTGGNPYLLRETTRALTGLEAPLDPVSGPPGELREVAGRLLETRLEGMGRQTVQTLGVAAVLGNRFADADLGRMVPNATWHLAEARSAGILVRGPGEGVTTFAHQLIHEAVYLTLAQGEILELHDAAAEAVALGDGPLVGRLDQVARHHLVTSGSDPDRAVGSLRAAADAHLSAFAYAEAATRYGQAAVVAARSGASGRLHCALRVAQGGALRQAGDIESVAVLVEAAQEAERLGQADLLAGAALELCRLGPTSLSGAADRQAARIAELALASDASPALLAEVAAAASLTHSMDGNPQRCRELYLRGEALARACGDPEVLARVLPHAYLGLGAPGDLDRRERAGHELLALARNVGSPAAEWEAHQLLFSVHLQRGDPALNDDLERLGAISEVLREPTREWETTYLRAAAAHAAGRLDEAEELADASLAAHDSVAPTRVWAVWGALLTAIRLDQGRMAELAGDVGAMLVDQPALPAWRAVLALAALEAGEPDKAAEQVAWFRRGGTVELPDDFTHTGIAVVLARAAAGLGEPAAIAELTAILTPLSGRMTWGGAGTYGPVDTALALLHLAAGRPHEAVRHLSIARDLIAGLGSAPQLAEVDRLAAPLR
jgi:DNA-binding SARP family transcriptional activator